VRHTAQGTTVEVTVGPEPRIVVRDHGPGVPPEQRTLAFERFWRADRTRSDGAGLGLGIVQATMQAHGGEARIEDADGGGAAFVLDFPPADPAQSST
jgi:signal transduction histidine kinase